MNRLLSGDVIEGLAVQAQTSPTMNVNVAAGSARIATGTYPTSYGYFVAIDTTTGAPAGEVVAITTASSSNPRIDTIVAYVDLAVTASTGTANNPNNMLKLAAVAGTPAASPAAPSTAAIQSAIGASNPFIKLANVTVGTSVTQINTANIADLRTLVSLSTPGSVLPNNLLAGAGTSWAWQNYVPTWTGLTVGNGTVTARYTQIGKTVHFKVLLVWGSTTSVSASVQMSLPATSTAVLGVGSVIGTSKLYDGTNQFVGPFTQSSTTQGVIRWYQQQGTGMKEANINASTPNTWVSGNEFHISGTYEVA